MFKIKCRKNGLNSEKRSVANLSKRVFVCEEIKRSENFQDLDVKINNKSLNNKIVSNVNSNSTIINTVDNGDG